MLKPVGKHSLSKGVKLGALLKDLGQHFHECCSCLQVLVVAQSNAVHQPGVNVGAKQVGHGLDCGVSQTVLVGVCLPLPLAVSNPTTGTLLLSLVSCKYSTASFSAVVEEVHEECKILEEQLTFSLHQISTIALFRLKRQSLQECGHCVHASLVQVPSDDCHIT